MDLELIHAARGLLPEGEVYCDWAASALALPPSAPCFIPPHHANSETLDKARSAVRKFLNDAEENYHIVFTAGTTASLQLLAHRIPWSDDDSFICHRHVHNAVLGIRNVAVHAGAKFASVSTKKMSSTRIRNYPERDEGFAVFAYPGECNVTGAVYPLSWAKSAKSEGLFGYPAGKVVTIVDTAKLIASSPFSIDEHPYIDALVFSLYKLSSTYSGLGVLLIRKNTLLEQLVHSSGTSSYFGGQSSDVITPFSATLHVPSPSLERALSNGTPNMQAIHALPEQLGCMTNMLGSQMRSDTIGVLLRRMLIDAFPRVEIHRDALVEENRATTSFTLYRGGNPIGHHEIATILALNGVHVRAGTMCNIGATATMLGLSDKDLVELHVRGYRCEDGADMVDGRPTGVVRVSFGWGSDGKDAERVVQVLQEFVGTGIKRPISGTTQRGVRELFVYPVKGCRGTSAETFTCSGGGLKGDRIFCVLDKRTEKVLDAKSCPKLAEFSCWYEVDEGRELLVLQCKTESMSTDVEKSKADARVSEKCGRETSCGSESKLAAGVEDENMEEWLSETLGRPAKLGVLHGYKRDALVVTEEEIEEIGHESGMTREQILRAIRPNVVVSGGGVSADFMTLTGSIISTRKRRCSRCTMVNVNSGGRKGEPLVSIARLCRRVGGGLVVGCIMRFSQGVIKVGDIMNCIT